jgi:integrase/recombinase XerD
MSSSLFDQAGIRKYLVAGERLAFARAARAEGGQIGSFCLTLAFTGARISEVLALTSERIDVSNDVIVFETLKQRRRAVFRAVPVPHGFIELLEKTHSPTSERERLWPWGRTVAWKYVKQVMRKGGIAEGYCKPKALRHAFAVAAGQEGVPLNVVQRWLGHARLETTAIYASALGQEERNLARRTSRPLEAAISQQSGC